MENSMLERQSFTLSPADLAQVLALDPDPVQALKLAWESADTGQDPAGPRQPERAG